MQPHMASSSVIPNAKYPMQCLMPNFLNVIKPPAYAGIFCCSRAPEFVVCFFSYRRSLTPWVGMEMYIEPWCGCGFIHIPEMFAFSFFIEHTRRHKFLSPTAEHFYVYYRLVGNALTRKQVVVPLTVLIVLCIQVIRVKQ